MLKGRLLNILDEESFMNMKRLTFVICLIALGAAHGQAQELEQIIAAAHGQSEDLELIIAANYINQQGNYGQIWEGIYGADMASQSKLNGTTLRQLIDGAKDGDVIELQPGVYRTSEGSLGFIAAIDKNLTIIGQGSVIVDGRRSSGALAIGRGNPNINVVISNIKFINCRGKNGGAILSHAKKLAVDKCLFGNNIAYNGSAIYNEGGELEICNSLIFNNFAARDGTIKNHNGRLIAKDCRIHENKVLNGGGGISSVCDRAIRDSHNLQDALADYQNNETIAQMLVKNCSFDWNKGDHGGAISGESCGLIIVDSTSFNSNQGAGGAICAYDSPLIVTGCKIVNNKVVENSPTEFDQYSGRGGGILVSEQDALIEDSSILDNEASVEESSMIIGNGGGISASYSNLTLNGCEIRGNRAQYGGGIDLLDGNLAVNGGTISDNRAKRVKVHEYPPFGSVSRCNLEEGKCEKVNMTEMAMDVGGYGGGISIRGNATLNGVRITGNRAAERGGAIYSSGRIKMDAGVEIASNQAEMGGGIFIEPSGHIVGDLGLISSNTPDNIYSPSEEVNQ